LKPSHHNPVSPMSWSHNTDLVEPDMGWVCCVTVYYMVPKALPSPWTVLIKA